MKIHLQDGCIIVRREWKTASSRTSLSKGAWHTLFLHEMDPERYMSTLIFCPHSDVWSLSWGDFDKAKASDKVWHQGFIPKFPLFWAPSICLSLHINLPSWSINLCSCWWINFLSFTYQQQHPSRLFLVSYPLPPIYQSYPSSNNWPLIHSYADDNPKFPHLLKISSIISYLICILFPTSFKNPTLDMISQWDECNLVNFDTSKT